MKQVILYPFAIAVDVITLPVQAVVAGGALLMNKLFGSFKVIR
jgi:hypothetical protein